MKLEKLKSKFLRWIIKRLYGLEHDIGLRVHGFSQCPAASDIESSSVGVVWQGPLVDQPKFLLGLEQYRRLLPRSKMVLSTWKGEASEQLRHRLSELDVELVESNHPECAGIMNVNRQIVSTSAGICAVKELSHIQHIVKVRTDYFPWRPDLAIETVTHLEDLLDDKGRIWAIDLNTRHDLPFSVGDIFQVGQKDQMIAFWSNDSLYPTNVTPQEFLKITNNQTNIAKIIEIQPAEIFLTRRYLDRMQTSHDPSSIESHLTALASHFGILSAEYIEFAFDKYAAEIPGYEKPNLRSKRFVHFEDWLKAATSRRKS